LRVTSPPAALTGLFVELVDQDRMLGAGDGDSLHQVLVDNGIPLRSDCGGQGRCGRCRVQLHAVGEAAADRSWPSALACQTRLSSSMAVRLPESSLIDPGAVVDKSSSQADALACVRPVAGKRLALAVDLGTTALAVYLCDLAAGRIIAVATARNPQAVYGADVISRISAAAGGAPHRNRMQRLVCRAVDRLADSLTGGSSRKQRRIDAAAVAGNPTMTHLFLGVDPSPLGRMPFRPAFSAVQSCPADRLGMGFNPLASVRTLPLLSGYLGGDIVAAALAVDLDRRTEDTLVIDIGTNGEILLAAGGRLYGTSCATGPAFEGAAIACGMPALPGAVDRWSCRPGMRAVAYTTLPDAGGSHTAARGLCGSGVVSAVAALRRAEVIDAGGRIDPHRARGHFRTDAAGVGQVLLVPADATAAGRSIPLTQKDIRAVQLAKSAIRTGIEMLCHSAGIKRPRRLLIAGTFGNHLQTADLITLGALPPIPPSDVVAVGNAAGSGTVCAVFDPMVWRRADELTRRVTVINLASQPAFQSRFVDALTFPETGGGP
jgi:uncharacterized 2Fe-2S/4Fe-4S cluster protein (DUF4445 family)